MTVSSLRAHLAPLALAAALFATGPCLAHGSDAPGAVTQRGAVQHAAKDHAAVLQLQREAQPLAASYRLTVTDAAGPSGKKPGRVLTQTWHFFRDAHQVAVLKAGTEEIWQRDAGGRLSFERVLHDDRHVVAYTAGELLTLGVQPAWAELATFIGTSDLAALRVVAPNGKPNAKQNAKHKDAQAPVLLAGRAGGESLQVQWLPDLQLPARVERRNAQGRVTRLELLQHAASAPAAWPVPGARSADYMRLDAADFGDMAQNPVVRKAEALDIRQGWRVSHAHD